MNKRFQTVNAHVESEALAPTTTIFWDPAVGPQAATIRFGCARYFKLTADGVYFGQPQADGEISVPASELLGTTIPVMLPGGQIVGEQPAELLDALLRGLFDKLYNERR